MKKTTILKLTGIISFIAITGFSMVGCASHYSGLYKPDREVAEDPPGLSVDPENCAYIGGPIRAIDDFDFNPEEGAMYRYSGRTVRVPAGETMVALIHYNYTASNTTYYGFKHVSLPPLENGGLYVLFFDQYAGGWEWFDDRQAVLRKLNIDTGEYEDVPGAAFVK
jgi:hypothetical protein